MVLWFVEEPSIDNWMLKDHIIEGHRYSGLKWKNRTPVEVKAERLEVSHWCHSRRTSFGKSLCTEICNFSRVNDVGVPKQLVPFNQCHRKSLSSCLPECRVFFYNQSTLTDFS